MLYIDAENSIYGRLSTFIAKKLLEGEEVTVVNASKVIITGKRSTIVKNFLERRDRGSVRKGPYYPRTPSMILRRNIGDMLPKKKEKGKDALRRCKVYAGIPSTLKEHEFTKVEKALNNKVSGFVKLEDISRSLGAEVRA